MIHIFKDFWRLIKTHKNQFIKAGAALITATCFQLMFPWVIRIAIDDVKSSFIRLPLLSFYAVCICLIAICESFFTYLKGRFSAAASEGVIRNLRNTIFRHLMLLPFKTHNEMSSGDIIQRATSDIQTLGRFLNVQIVEVARTFCLLIGVSILMFFMHPILASAALSILIPIFVFSLYFFGKIHDRFEQVDEREADLSSMIQEYLSGIRVVRAFAREDHERSVFSKANSNLVNQEFKLAGLHAFFWPISDLMCMFQVILILILGGLKVIHGEISMGTFVAFNSYVMLLIWPVRHVGRLLGEMGRTSVSVKRIHEILNLPVEEISQPSGLDIPWRYGSIEYRNVSFNYGSKTILHNIDFRIMPGRTVAVLGTTGSGKTTLVQLLTRFHDDFSGEILIGGREIRTIPQSDLRSNIGFVLQESFLFSRSLYENIAFADPNVSEKEVLDAARTAHVDQFISEFSQGYQTCVGERGVTLSGGQRQRVALARVLVKHPAILILDDTTSALDTETEAGICEKLKRDLSGSTALIITHRLSTASGADWILVLNEGTLAQQGTHETLIRQSGPYREWYEHHWARQAQLNEEIHHETNKKNQISLENPIQLGSLAEYPATH